MDAIRTASHFLHRHLLGLIIASYALAATCPALGLWLRQVRIGAVALGGGRLAISVPTLLLSFLLFHAGLRVRLERVREITRRPTVLLVGLVANLAVPVAYILTIMPAMSAWHNPTESGTLVLGLALVAAMPVAGSSTGWAQHSGGDMTLSLGLVLASTLLSPLTTPAAFRLLGAAAPEGVALELHRLAGRDAGAFLALWVLLPSVAGILVSSIVGHSRLREFDGWLKPAGPVVLLALCYSNASACLPQVFGTPDWDFLAVTIGFVVGLCALTFVSGHLLGRLLGAEPDAQAALMFGMGMNNNGTGLVLASAALASQPLVLLPIIIYNLAQHMAASCACSLLYGVRRS
jgi:BASS family bile acid:Na+ symporter